MSAITCANPSCVRPMILMGNAHGNSSSVTWAATGAGAGVFIESSGPGDLVSGEIQPICGQPAFDATVPGLPRRRARHAVRTPDDRPAVSLLPLPNLRHA